MGDLGVIMLPAIIFQMVDYMAWRIEFYNIPCRIVHDPGCGFFIFLAIIQAHIQTGKTELGAVNFNGDSVYAIYFVNIDSGNNKLGERW